MGHTAIAEVQFSDYIFPAFDQVCINPIKRRTSMLNKDSSLSTRPQSFAIALADNSIVGA
jgi:pyruvate/2-oxoglutarate/acetoin dehydrogenase E1 component